MVIKPMRHKRCGHQNTNKLQRKISKSFKEYSGWQPTSTKLSLHQLRSCTMLTKSEQLAFWTWDIRSHDALLPIAAKFEIRRPGPGSVLGAEHHVPFPFATRIQTQRLWHGTKFSTPSMKIGNLNSNNKQHVSFVFFCDIVRSNPIEPNRPIASKLGSGSWRWRKNPIYMRSKNPCSLKIIPPWTSAPLPRAKAGKKHWSLVISMVLLLGYFQGYWVIM